jgi:hypothetical protein
MSFDDSLKAKERFTILNSSKTLNPSDESLHSVSTPVSLVPQLELLHSPSNRRKVERVF